MKAPPPTKTLTEADTEEETAQAEFLRDLQASLEEMKDGKVLPAEEALQLIELGLDDDELERSFFCWGPFIESFSPQV